MILKIIKIDIDKLIDADYNPRKKLVLGDEEYEKIKNSIESFGYIEPIIINKDFTIISGHQRKSVLKDLGKKTVDCIIVNLSKKKEKALNIALNKISGEWDMERLFDVLRDIKTDDENGFLLTGFSEHEFDELFKKFDDKNNNKKEVNFEANEDNENNVIKICSGDVFKLGEYEIICSKKPKSNRIELTEKECRVVIEHWEQSTGEKVIKDVDSYGE